MAGEIQTRVFSKRVRPGISLPTIPDGQTDQQPKLRGALKSLIENESNYTDSLRTLTDIFEKVCASENVSTTNAAEITHRKVEEILSIHQMFHIGFDDALKEWYSNGSVGNSLSVFTTKMVIDVYSEYINNFEASMETMRAITNPRRSIRGSVQRNRQKLLAQLSCNIVKPVQRFPQLIMIIKDLLKYTPRDHHDRGALQEALTGIENVAFQLNERKRHNDQFRHGRMIMEKLTPKSKAREGGYLIRDDNMDLLTENSAREFHIEQRKVLLMNEEVLLVEESRKESFTVSSCKYEYRWRQRLRNLQLTNSANILNRLTFLYANGTPGLGLDNGTGNYADLDEFVAEVEVAKHDIAVLEQTKRDLAKLKRSYKVIDEIQDTISYLQDETKHLMYNMLQMLQARYIFLFDIPRGRVFPFCVPNAKVKQDWCVDFIMARLARESRNRPCWYSRERTDKQPALMLKYSSVLEDQPTYQIRCATRVHVSLGKDSSTTEHLLVCSSNGTSGSVSLFPIHIDSSKWIHNFPVFQCDLICVERVTYVDTVGQQVEGVWISTSDSEIRVFTFNQVKPDAYMTPKQVLRPGSIVVSIVNVENHVICGTSSGHVFLYSRNDSIHREQAWAPTHRVKLGFGPVTSLIRIGDDIWAACGAMIYVLNKQNVEIQHKVSHHMDNPELRIQHLVKAGVGVWASFHGSPDIVLFHGESRKVLQEISIVQATSKFLEEYPQENSTTDGLEVTSLLVSLGLLWVGTSLGIILTYPLPRLRDGVPRINQRPHVALHGHNGPIRFLVPFRFDPVVQESVFNQSRSPRGLDRSTSSVKDKGLELRISREQTAMKEVSSGALAEVEENNDTTDNTLSVDINIPDLSEANTENLKENTNDIATTLVGNGNFMKIPNSNEKHEVVSVNDKEENKTCRKNKGVINESDQNVMNRRSASFTDITDAESNSSGATKPNYLEEERISHVTKTAKDQDKTDVKQVVKTMADDKTLPKTISCNEGNLKKIEESSGEAVESIGGRTDVKDDVKPRASSDSLTDFDVKEEKLNTLFGTLMKTDKEEETEVKEVLANQTQRYKSMPIKEVESNVILVLSGGNGYKDMKKRQKEKNKENDQTGDPSIILWMYKC